MEASAQQLGKRQMSEDSVGVWLRPPIQLCLPMAAPPSPGRLLSAAAAATRAARWCVELLVSVESGDAPSLAAAGAWQWGRRLAGSFVGHGRKLVPDAAQPV